MPSACKRSCAIRARLAAMAIALGSVATAAAQEVPRGLLAPGDAAVTGFSGATRPLQVAQNVNPAVQTYIDINGASLRIVDLQSMGGPPRGQHVGAHKPVSVTADRVGQVTSCRYRRHRAAAARSETRRAVVSPTCRRN